MAMLDDLLNIDGVFIAFEFTADGKCAGYKAKAKLSDEQAALIAQFCATVTMNFNTLAGAFTKLSGQKWTPQQGWAYAGGEYTVAIGGDGYRGVFVETAKADYNKLFAALVGPR
jgi:roadblock/LC7 domain-containing protein